MNFANVKVDLYERQTSDRHRVRRSNEICCWCATQVREEETQFRVSRGQNDAIKIASFAEWEASLEEHTSTAHGAAAPERNRHLRGRTSAMMELILCVTRTGPSRRLMSRGQTIDGHLEVDWLVGVTGCFLRW